MMHAISSMRVKGQRLARIGGYGLLAVLSGWTAENARAAATDLPLVPRWQRFERSLRSEENYAQPDTVRLQVELRSPQGEVQRVPGFWDGGRTWRFRVLPGVAGRWSYRTECSDTNNAGLHHVRGEFLCTAGEPGNRFRVHGGVRVAREGVSFEHADRTPIFLVSELAWNAVRREPRREFEARLAHSARQGVNAFAWTLWPGKDEHGETVLEAGTGQINLDVLQRLEPRVEAITRAGLLNLIAPTWEMRGESPVDETALAALWTQAIARWHANPSLWLVAVESSTGGANIGRWRRIAAEVFADGPPAPVVLLPGETQWLWDEFRAAPWVSALGFKTAHLVSDDALQWFVNGPIAVAHQQRPVRPVLNLLPAPPGDTLAENIRARQLLWWSLLLNPPAGVSRPVESDSGPAPRHDAALLAAGFMSGIEFWRLRPAPQVLAVQPGLESPRRFVAAAASERRDLLVVYAPDGPAIELRTAAVPPRHSSSWFNPANGERILAAGKETDGKLTYRTPGSGDWVLLIRAER